MHDIVGQAWVNTHTKHEAVACTWLSSGCHWDFRPQRMTRQKYKHMHNTGTASQWSSPPGTSHMVTWMCSARHMGYDVVYTKMRWHGQMKHFRRVNRHALAPSHNKSASDLWHDAYMVQTTDKLSSGNSTRWDSLRLAPITMATALCRPISDHGMRGEGDTAYDK